MECGFVRIAHLSDLHLSIYEGDFNPLDAVKADLVNHKPHLIIVTGDIADNLGKLDLKNSLTKAKSYLELLCKDCGLDLKQHLFVVPGNHDYRFKGILGFWKRYPDIFKEIFVDYNKTRFISDLNLFIGCFDSNTTNQKINLANGQVLRDEFINFNNSITECKDKFGLQFEGATRVALLHHHPMPIHRSEFP